jgi:hypothetical protein
MTAQIPVGTPGIGRHDVLGRLTVDVKRVRRSYDGCPEVEVFDGEIKATIQADGTAVGIILIPEFLTDVDTDLPSWVDRCAARIIRAIADLEAFKAQVADDLLPLKNSGWLGDGEAPLTKAEFITRLRLDGVNHYDESMDLFFDDGGMFLGHSLMVTIEGEHKPDRAQLVG